MPDADTEPHPDTGAAVLAPYVAQIHEHQQIQWLEGVHVRVLLDAATTDGQLAVVEEVSTQSHATPLHLHPGDDQSFIVLEGSLRVWVGDDRYDVDAGGIAFLPRGIPHAVRVTSPGARILVVGTPAGEEELFRRAGWDLSQPPPAEWTLAPSASARPPPPSATASSGPRPPTSRTESPSAPGNNYQKRALGASSVGHISVWCGRYAPPGGHALSRRSS